MTHKGKARAVVLAAVAVASLAGAAPSAAAVRYASPSGSGSACSQGSPCTVTVAVESASDNDEVVVAPGDYDIPSGLTINDSGLNVHGAAGQPAPLLHSGGTAVTFDSFGMDDTLRHLRIEAGYIGVYGGNAGAPYTFADVQVKATDRAFFFATCTVVKMTDVVANSTAGPYAIDIISNDTIWNTKSFVLRNVTAVATAAGSTAISLSADPSGSTTDRPATMDAKNTIARGALYDLAEHGANVPNSATLHVAYSNYRPGSVNGVITNDGHNQSADPSFVNAAAGDLHELAGSATVDAGTPDAQNGPSDIDGDPRGIGLAPDIGADEYQPPRTGLATSREYARGVLLQDGRVLVTGGDHASGVYPRNSELFDPSTGLWSAGGYLSAGRAFATATVLENGKVLVAGGENPGLLQSAELYNPVSDSWSAAGTMTASARKDHTATLLGNGKVLVTGGSDSANPLGSTTIYNPVTNTWAAGTPLSGGRANHTATLLSDGRVLVVGGTDPSFTRLASAEVSNPAGTTWTSAGTMTTARAGHTATLLQNGKVLVAGGVDSAGLETNTAELYDPAANSWLPAGSLASARNSATATLLRDGRVLVTGGSGPSGVQATTEIYDPATNSWSAGPPLAAKRQAHTSTGLLNGRVLSVGGNQAGAPIAGSELSPAFGPNATARRPVIAYVAPTGEFGLYDSETGTDVPPPPLPANVARFTTSLGGRYVGWVDPATQKIHLYDRFAHAEVPLPGIDLGPNPDGLTVSDSGLIGFDHNSSGPAQVYDSKAKSFVDTGLAADNNHRQTHLSGDGRFLATTCNVSGCVTPPVTGSDAYVQDLSTRLNVPFPDNPSGTNGDEEHPCIDGNGGLVGVDIGHPATVHDVFLYNRANGALLPNPQDATIDEMKCVLDSRGQHLGIADNVGHLRLYDRLTGAFVALPAKIGSPAWFSDPIDMAPPETTIVDGPSGVVASASATLVFTSSEAGSTFECSIDGTAFSPCGSPRAYTALVPGSHTFLVRATDPSGNTDPSPASRTWTVAEVATISKLKVSPSALLAAPRGTSIARVKYGATVSYTVSLAASVTFTVGRRKSGRRIGKSCVKPTSKNRNHKRCTRVVVLKGRFTHAGKAGKRKFHFTGRLRGRKLAAARYVLIGRPAGATASAAKRASFRIKRP